MDGDAAAAQGLPDVVIGVAGEADRHAVREEGAQRLAGGAGQVDLDGAVREPLVAVLPGDLVAEHGAHRAVRVLDRLRDGDVLALGQGRCRQLDERAVEDGLEAVLLALDVVERGAGARLRHREDGAEVEALGLPVGDRPLGVEQVGAADGLLDGAQPQAGEDLADLLGDVAEEGDDELGAAGEALAQDRVLRGDAHRAGVEVALAHHDAAGDDERRGREAELLGAEERRDDDVAAGLELAVALDDDAVAQVVEDEGLLGLGQADLPGGARVLDARERGRAGAAVEAGDEDDVGLGLGHARGDRADADLGDELDVDAGLLVGVLEVADELGEVLDGVDVVVRRRGDEPDAGGGPADLGDPRVDLVGRELAALAGLGALGHLDLDVLGEGEVLGGDAEAAGGDLLDLGAALGVVEALARLAALTGVGLAAQAVHRDGEGLVGLAGDGAVAHRARGESLDDLLDALDLLERDGLDVLGAQAHEAAQRHELLGLVVDLVGVAAEDLPLLGAGRVLEAGDGRGVEEVVLALAAPLVVAAGLERAVRRRDARGRVGLEVSGQHLLGDDVEADAAQRRGRAGEVLVDELLGQAHGLEDLGAAVGGDGGDAHLGHDLEDAVAEGVDEVVDGGVRVDLDGARAGEVLDGLHGEVRADRGGAVADEEGDVVDLADVAGLDDEPDLGARVLAQQVVVDGAREEQRRDGGHLRGGLAVRQDDEARTGLGGGVDLGEDLLEALAQGGLSPADAEQALDLRGGEALGGLGATDVGELGELVRGEDREGDDELARVLRGVREEVRLGADRRGHRGDELLAVGVERRVGHLGEELAEVVEDEARSAGENRDGRVGAHGADRLGAVDRHRGQERGELLVGVAEGLLAAQDGGGGVPDVLALGQVLEADHVLGEPLVVGGLGGETGLDLGVGDDAAGVEVDEEHGPRLEAAAGGDVGLVDGQHAGLRGEHDGAVLGGRPATGAQSVAVHDGADLGAVGEDHGGGAVPGLDDVGAVLVEGADLGVHRRVLLPGLGHEHGHGVGHGAAGEGEELEDLVEGGGVGAALGAHGQEGLEVAEELGAHEALAGGHPVAVAAHGVDLAVVGDHAEGLGEGPRREGVRGEAGVDERHAGGDALVGEVREEGGQLLGREHALVDEGPGGQGGHVDAGLLLRAAAQAVGEAVEADAGGAPGAVGDDEVAELRHGAAGGGADHGVVGGDVAPANDAQALLAREALDGGDGLGARLGALVRAGQEDEADGVGARPGQADDLLAEEGVGDRHEDAGAIAGVLLGADGAAVVEAGEDVERVGDDGVGGGAVEAGHEAHAAGVVLIGGVVEALPLGCRRAGGGLSGLLHGARPLSVGRRPRS